MKNFRTYQLAKLFYLACKTTHLPGPASNQFKRAALSIVLNLAEGSAKPTAKDRKRLYAIAFGSFREVQALLDIHDEKALLQKADILGAHLYKLCSHR